MAEQTKIAWAHSTLDRAEAQRVADYIAGIIQMNKIKDAGKVAPLPPRCTCGAVIRGFHARTCPLHGRDTVT